jgi:quaternary ammonium compound-resistance protein SugE
MTTVTVRPVPATDSTPRRASAWAVLLLAGAFEVGYALSVAGSQGLTDTTWSVVAAVFFLLTLFCLSRALRAIDVGLGYAVWAGIGAVGSAVLGPVFFDETLTLTRAAWLAVIIAGVVWLKLADRPGGEPRVRHPRSQRPDGDDPAAITAGGRVRWY